MLLSHRAEHAGIVLLKELLRHLGYKRNRNTAASLISMTNDIIALSQKLLMQMPNPEAISNMVKLLRLVHSHLAAVVVSATSDGLQLPEKEHIALNQHSWTETAERMGVKRENKARSKVDSACTAEHISEINCKRNHENEDPYGSGEQSGKRAKPDARSAAANVNAQETLPCALSPPILIAPRLFMRGPGTNGGPRGPRRPPLCSLPPFARERGVAQAGGVSYPFGPLVCAQRGTGKGESTRNSPPPFSRAATPVYANGGLRGQPPPFCPPRRSRSREWGTTPEAPPPSPPTPVFAQTRSGAPISGATTNDGVQSVKGGVQTGARTNGG
ncbi:hypothetical protein EDB83DRAFT_2678747 [Lactarius deliciosus]|nr:hypothetical protein EDB83DRAFT_2678747 [Lactarius deliciosus]